MLEPCYEVGGDGFDYAVNKSVIYLAVLDAVGRGLPASMTCAVALSAIRAARRAGEGLAALAPAVDAALASEFTDYRFVTAILAELNEDSGRLRYVNAGHPLPLLLRGNKAVLTLGRGRRLPLGLGGAPAEVGEAVLEPGDRLLLHTDGVTDARRADGGRSGLAHLVDLAKRYSIAGLPAAETLRRLNHAILDQQGGQLRDDATLLLVEWSTLAARRSVP